MSMFIFILIFIFSAAGKASNLHGRRQQRGSVEARPLQSRGHSQASMHCPGWQTPAQGDLVARPRSVGRLVQEVRRLQGGERAHPLRVEKGGPSLDPDLPGFQQ